MASIIMTYGGVSNQQQLKKVRMLTPSPRESSGLSDSYTDLLGGEPLQDNFSGSKSGAEFTVVAGGVTGKQIIIPTEKYGGNVTWIRGCYALSATPRYDAFMADFNVGDATNYADATQAATNDYVGGVLSTTVPIKATVAEGTVLQCYYSFRTGQLSLKGQAIAGWPMLHIDPYQGTANDGDNYMMMALYHAYRSTGKIKYKTLADRIGYALFDAGRWSTNRMFFDLDINKEAGQYGLYWYNAPATPFAYETVRRPYDVARNCLRITTQVDSGGPPYNFSGFGNWFTFPVTSGTPFNSLDITLMGDVSKRFLEINTNISESNSSDGDLKALIPFLSTESETFITASITKSMLWKTGNVVYDALHQDYSFSGTYGSDISVLSSYEDIENRRIITRFSFNFSGNPNGYAGFYFGGADDTSAGTTAFNFEFYSENIGKNVTPAHHVNSGHWVDESYVDGQGNTITAGHWVDEGYDVPEDQQTPLIGRVAFSAKDSDNITHEVIKEVTAGWQSLSIAWSDFSSTFAHPVLTLYVDAYSTTVAPGHWVDQGYWNPVSQSWVDTGYWVPATSYEMSVGSFGLDRARYDAVISMADVPHTEINGFEIKFPANDLGTPYVIHFGEININQTVIDGPASDPQRYMGIPRWTYKWMGAEGAMGYGSWRGPSAVGYNWLMGWTESGIVNPDNGRVLADTMRQMMYDSQQAYIVQFPGNQVGPFMPRYGRPSWEALNTEGYIAGLPVTNTYNKWYFPDTDDWYGYMYRALLSVAGDYYISRSAQSKVILDNWMSWLDVHIIADGEWWRPPSEFLNTGAVGYSYRPVYAYACIAAACIYKYWVDGDAIALKWYRRLLDDIFARKRLTATGELQGISRITEGSGYTTATVNITGDGTGAAATAFIAGGKITHYDIVSAGSGYTTLTATVTGDGTGATCHAFLSDLLVGAFDTAHTGWEISEVFNTYAMLVLGSRPGGTVDYPTTATANDMIAFEGLIALYQRNTTAIRPSLLNSAGIPIHEWDIDPYHNGSGIENPMVRDTHVRGATWTETLGPTMYAAVELGRYTGNYNWLTKLFYFCTELTNSESLDANNS